MPDALELLRSARCGACGQEIGKRVNLVDMNRRATWKYPVAGNILTGEDGHAVAVVCDSCVDNRRDIAEAVEVRDGQLVYHRVAGLRLVLPGT